MANVKAESLGWMSSEEEGVGGSFTRGIVRFITNRNNCYGDIEEKWEWKSDTKVLKVAKLLNKDETLGNS